MRRVVAPLLLALAIVSPLTAQPVATPGPTTPYSRLYVFGDSYSDIGAGYIDGNGPTAVAYLGWLMGLPVASSKTANAAGKSLVFAVSGAGTGEGAGRQVKDALIGYGDDEPGARLRRAREGRRDRLRSPDDALLPCRGTQRQPARYRDHDCQSPAAAPDSSRARRAAFHPCPVATKIQQFAAVGLRLNPAYEQFVREEAAAAGIDLWLNGWGAAFDEVFEHPAAHGIVNTTSACAGRAIFDQDPTPVGDPATYFFYHEGHPSTAVHRVVGKRLFEEIAARPPAGQ